MKKIAIFWILFCFTIIVIPATSLFNKEVVLHDSMINLSSSSHSQNNNSEKSESNSSLPVQSAPDSTLSQKEVSSSQSVVPEEKSEKSEESSGSSENTNAPTTGKEDWRSITHFNILNISTNKIQKVSVEDYVRGAVTAELPPTFHPEALKAQAVSAHTYALMNTINNNNEGYD